MTAYLICEDGPHAGQIVTLADSNEWIIGRDPDVSFQVLEDPMVSRKHCVVRYEGLSPSLLDGLVCLLQARLG